MNEYTSPGEVPVPETENVTSALWRHEQERPDHAILSYRSGDSFIPITYADMAARVRRLAAGLMGLGFEKGDRVCLFSPTRYEFTLLDYAIWAAGCAGVTIYETSSAEQVEWIVTDSGAKAVICADDSLADVLRKATVGLDRQIQTFVIDSGGLDQLREAGSGISDDEVMERARSVVHDDLATLVYTSGTTGQPKGCDLSVHNFVWTTQQAVSVLGDMLHPAASTLMFLPLAHIFARIAQVGSVSRGGLLAYSTGIPNLMEELAMVKPTWLFSVPRVFEKVYNGASQKAHAEGKGRIFDIAARTATEWSRQSLAGDVRLRTRLAHGLFDRLVYSKLRAALGGRVEYAASGGAALGERLGHFFNGIGVRVLEGYGLTETSAVAHVNPPEAPVMGTVGKPLPGASVAIADDGEVLIKGSNVFRGYWHNPEATADVMSDGWFHSGDIGSLKNGYLRITGRKKELIVTAGGKNVSPAILEDRLRAHPLVSQAMVVGDDRPFIAALVTIDPEEFPRWAAEKGITAPLAESTDHPELIDAVQEGIDRANAAVSKAESIRSFTILAEDFSIEGGELTPTLKVRRAVVNERYSEAIEGLYTR